MELDTKKIGILASKLLGKISEDEEFRNLTNLELGLIFLEALKITQVTKILEVGSSDPRDEKRLEYNREEQDYEWKIRGRR